MNKNVCIVHYNTPTLTSHLVMSINKHTPGTTIYIFDNSDKKPFKNTFENVIVFDNTKGQIINFDQWLKKYPNKTKSGGKANNWGSAKHAYSVEKCMDLIKEPFLLLDSDVLIKNDVSGFFEEDICYKGEVILQPNRRIHRVLPFICYINTPLCVQRGVHYFDERYMHGLKVGNDGDNYDTGAALFLLTNQTKSLHKEIKVADYIVHYGNGSWVSAAEKMRKPKHIPQAEWLNKYKSLWADEKSKEPMRHFYDVFDHIYCLHYLPNPERLPKLKSELKRVGIDENAEYFSWKYDFPSPLLDSVYKNPKMVMDRALTTMGRPYIKNVSLRHYEIIKEAYTLGYKRILIMENDVRFHNDLAYIGRMLSNIPDTDIVMFDKMTCSSVKESAKYKKYVSGLPEGTLYGDMKGIFFIFCSCYSLNRKAMARFIELQEKKLLPPDTPLNDQELTGSFAVVNVAIQDPGYKQRKVESYSRINLDTELYGKDAAEPMPVNDIESSGSPAPARRVIRSQAAIALRKGDFLKDKAKRNPVRRLHEPQCGHNRLYDVI